MLPFNFLSKTATNGHNPSVNFNCESGHELISFEPDRFHMFAAEVHYCEPHWHAAPELITVLEGRFLIVIGQQSFELESGGMIYINPEDVHSLQALREDSRLLTVQFSPQLFDESLAPPSVSFNVPDAETAIKHGEKVRQSLHELATVKVLQANGYALRAAVYRLLAAIASAGDQDTVRLANQRDRKESQIVRQCMRSLATNLQNEMSLSDAAEQSGVSYHHFSRMFKRVSGYTFTDYMMLLRVNRAKTLLRDPGTLITDVGYMSGFKEHKHLIFAFKKHCSMTPSEYRKRVLSPANVVSPPGHSLVDIRCVPLTLEIVDCLALSN